MLTHFLWWCKNMSGFLFTNPKLCTCNLAADDKKEDFYGTTDVIDNGSDGSVGPDSSLL